MNSPSSRRAFTLQKKLEVLRVMRECDNNATECERQTGIDRRVIGRWLKMEDQLKGSAGKRNKKRLRLKSGCWYPELERELYNWIFDVRYVRKRPIQVSDIQIQAGKIIARAENTSAFAGFKVSKNWVRKFMARNGLCYRTATHKAQENNKSQEDRVNDVVVYLSNLNRLVEEFEVCCLIKELI